MAFCLPLSANAQAQTSFFLPNLFFTKLEQTRQRYNPYYSIIFGGAKEFEVLQFLQF